MSGIAESELSFRHPQLRGNAQTVTQSHTLQRFNQGGVENVVGMGKMGHVLNFHCSQIEHWSGKLFLKPKTLTTWQSNHRAAGIQQAHMWRCRVAGQI